METAAASRRSWVGILLFVVEAHPADQIQLLPERHRSLTVKSDADIVERRLRRRLADRKVDKRIDDERRERVHRVLIVVLREDEDAALPAQRGAVGQFDRRRRRRSQTDFLRELEALLAVITRGERKRRVVEI